MISRKVLDLSATQDNIGIILVPRVRDPFGQLRVLTKRIAADRCLCSCLWGRESDENVLA